MRIIQEIPEEKIKAMHYYYDPLYAGICIQKYIETEDGKGDFMPVYANKTFSESMGIPLDMVYKFSLRQVTKEFPDKQLQDMVEVAFDGRVIIGDSFAKDYSKYFSVRIYQYCYGYTIMFMSDVTMGHINANTLQSVSRAYDEIYYARITDPVCSQVHPPMEGTVQTKGYEELIQDIINKHEIHSDDKIALKHFFEKETLCRSLSSEENITQRFRVCNTENKYIWCMAEVIVNERVQDEPVAFVIALKNIDDIVQAEKVKQEELEAAYETVKSANESKDKFLKIMSHDLRTPLNGILGMIQLLEDRNLSEELRSTYHNNIRHSAENLLALFNEVLEITRLDSANIKHEKKEINLCRMRKEMIALCSQKDTEIKIDFKQIRHPVRLGADAYLRQIVFHLINNALKFNVDNNPIEFYFEELEDSDVIKLVVKDHGIGMSEEFQSQVFNPFAQEHGDSRTTYEGSGLGLTYIKRIIDELNGKIYFESTLGKGSAFTVELPLEIDFEKEKELLQDKALHENETGSFLSELAEEDSELLNNKQTYSLFHLKGKKALIVEDNEINQVITESMLDSVGIVSDSAENGKVGLDKFVASKPGEYDFILMDIMMPVMDGLESTRLIRESSHLNAKTVPIIAVSANSFPEDVKKGMDAGVNAYLSKPLSQAELFEILGTVVPECNEAKK